MKLLNCETTARVEAVEEALHKNSWRRPLHSKLFEANNCGVV